MVAKAALQARNGRARQKPHSTGRGSGLKSFICKGQRFFLSPSPLFPTLTPLQRLRSNGPPQNQGKEAYKPSEYGKTIAITRRFTKEGGSSWKIKNKDGKVIRMKKEELAMIDQVDNAMNVLTQGLTSSSVCSFLSCHAQKKD